MKTIVKLFAVLILIVPTFIPTNSAAQEKCIIDKKHKDELVLQNKCGIDMLVSFCIKETTRSFLSDINCHMVKKGGEIIYEFWVTQPNIHDYGYRFTYISPARSGEVKRCPPQPDCSDLMASKLDINIDEQEQTASDKEFWGAVAFGKSGWEKIGNFNIPFPIPYDFNTSVWNHPNPQSAIAEVLRECKKAKLEFQHLHSCGVQAVFSSSANGNTGEFLKEKCIRTIVWNNPKLEMAPGFIVSEVKWFTGELPEFFRDQEVLANDLICNYQ